MIVQLNISAADAEALLVFLNRDEGYRATVVERLVPENKPERVRFLTAVTSGLGAVSRALALALDAERTLGQAARQVNRQVTESRRLMWLD